MLRRILRRYRGPFTTAVLGAAFALLVAGCGSPEPTATSAPTATPEPTATSAPAAAATATPTLAPGATAPPAPTSTATPTPGKAAWEVRWEETVAKAKEEGELVIIGGGSVVASRAIQDHFEQLFDIKVSSSGGNSTEFADRVLAERSAGIYTIDLFWSGLGTATGRLVPNGVLDPVADHLILEEVVDESLWFQGRHWYADLERKYIFSFASSASQMDISGRYNTQQMSLEEAQGITSLWDFLEPEWKGKIVAMAPTQGYSGRYPAAYGNPTLGPEFIERFFSPELGVTFFSDERLAADQLLLGKFAVCLFCSGTTTQIDAVRQFGAPVGDFTELAPTWTDAAVLSSSSSSALASMVNRAAHPNAADLYLNWWLSKEGQTAMHTLTNPNRVPLPTLRDDVTDWGITLEAERREPGKEYVLLEFLETYDPVLALEEVARLYAQRGT